MAVETVFELGKLTRYMFFPDGMEGPRQRGLNVAQQCIHPFERRVLRRPATTAADDRHMPATPAGARAKVEELAVGTAAKQARQSENTTEPGTKLALA